MFFASSKSRQRARISDIGVLKTSGHIQIKTKILNPSEEPRTSSKSPYKDLMDMAVLCTFKIKLESQKLEHEFSKDQWPYPNQDQDKNPSQELPASSRASNHNLKDIDILWAFNFKRESQIQNNNIAKTSNPLQVNIKIPKPCQKPPATSKVPNILCTFKIKIVSQNLEPGYSKDK